MTETLPTTERVASWAVIRSEILRKVIEHRPKIGSMPCPRCESGELYYCVTADGTISAACETDGCVHIEPPSASLTPHLPMSWSARSPPREEA